MPEALILTVEIDAGGAVVIIPGDGLDDRTASLMSPAVSIAQALVRRPDADD